MKVAPRLIEFLCVLSPEEKKARQKQNLINYRNRLTPEQKEAKRAKERRANLPEHKLAEVRTKDSVKQNNRIKNMTPEQKAAHLKNRRNNYRNLPDAKKRSLLDRVKKYWTKQNTKAINQQRWQRTKLKKATEPNTLPKTKRVNRVAHWHIKATGDNNDRHYLLQQHVNKAGESKWGFPRIAKADIGENLTHVGSHRIGSVNHHYQFDKTDTSENAKSNEMWATRHDIAGIKNLHSVTRNYFEKVKPIKRKANHSFGIGLGKR